MTMDRALIYDVGSFSRLLLRRSLFWEVHENAIEELLFNSRPWVIVRVFEYGTIEDIQDVIEIYGEETTRCELLAMEQLFPMTRAMAFLFLGIDKEGRYA
jgi:hypothetical protein